MNIRIKMVKEKRHKIIEIMISRKYQNNQLSRYYVDKIAISNSNVKAPLETTAGTSFAIVSARVTNSDVSSLDTIKIGNYKR